MREFQRKQRLLFLAVVWFFVGCLSFPAQAQTYYITHPQLEQLIRTLESYKQGRTLSEATCKDLEAQLMSLKLTCEDLQTRSEADASLISSLTNSLNRLNDSGLQMVSELAAVNEVVKRQKRTIVVLSVIIAALILAQIVQIVWKVWRR